MRFTLHYRGPLKSNGNPEHKHQLREVFHQQLKCLWAQPPLKEHVLFLEPRRKGLYCLRRPLGKHIFVPLVTREMDVVAELSIIMLRPEIPGQLVTQGGDIDNRLKTLFDALTMPRHTNALPSRVEPKSTQKPFFFCLLEDDNLITSVSVETEQMLAPVRNKSTVDVLIRVNTRITRPTIDNHGFS